MSVETVLEVILIIIALAIVKQKDNLKIVILFSVFSLVAASLYFLYSAPDVALAEAAMGSAIIPLLFIIAIKKQKEFLIINKNEDDYFKEGGEGYNVLKEFCDFYGLKMIIEKTYRGPVYGVFGSNNIDLMIEEENGKYVLKGKKASIILNKLEEKTKNLKDVRVERVEQSEKDD